MFSGVEKECIGNKWVKELKRQNPTSAVERAYEGDSFAASVVKVTKGQITMW